MSAIQEMRQVCQPRKMNRRGKMVFAGSCWYNKYCTRYFSIYFTWFFVKLGVGANGITALMLICGLLGPLLCMPHSVWITILGVFFLCMFEVLDCVDGEVARWAKKTSVKGVYLDKLSHLICHR